LIAFSTRLASAWQISRPHIAVCSEAGALFSSRRHPAVTGERLVELVNAIGDPAESKSSMLPGLPGQSARAEASSSA